MSLRKSPTLTTALLASNRRNAKKSTGPRSVRGQGLVAVEPFAARNAFAGVCQLF